MENLTDFYSQPTTGSTFQIGGAFHMYGSMQTTTPAMSSGSKYAPVMSNNGVYYYSADEFLEQSLIGHEYSETQAIMLTGKRPTDPSIGELAPVGDTLVPLLLCAVIYTAQKTIRKLIKTNHSL